MLCESATDAASISGSTIADRRSFRKSFVSDAATDTATLSDGSSSSCYHPDSTKPTRAELNQVLGDDITPHTTEISSIPCAGVRISQGRLKGLMAWRFVVQLDEPSAKFRSCPRPGIVTNFILDTGSNYSPVPAETLLALGYPGKLVPGREVMLTVQGIRTKCVVAHPGEAGRLCGLFTTAGSLTFYFDARLDAPVLYVADQDLDNPKPEHVPRTVKMSMHQRVLSMFNFKRLP